MNHEQKYKAHCRQFVGKTAADFPGRYCETHHILAVHLGGGDEPENLVTMPYADHVEAHRLLWLWCEAEGNVGETAYIYLAMTQQLKGGRKSDLRRNPLNEEQLADLEAARIQATEASRERERTEDLAVVSYHQGRSWTCSFRLKENGKGITTTLLLPAKRFTAEQLRAEAVALRKLRDEQGCTVAEMKAHWLQVRQPELTGKKPRKTRKQHTRRAIKGRRVGSTEWQTFGGQREAAIATGCNQGGISKQLRGVSPYAAGLPGKDDSRWMFEFV